MEGKKNKKKFFMIINLLRSNYEFLFYLSIFYSVYVIYNKWKDLSIIIKSGEIPNKINNSNNLLNKFWFYFTFLIIIICIYYISKKFLGINDINNNEYRTIKLLLGFFISFLTLFISIKEKGFKSWKTLFSLFSLCLLIFYVSLLFDEEWKVFIYGKLNSYIIGCSIWICIFLSFFSHEYMYMLDINIMNNLKTNWFKLRESELVNKADMMKIEDLLNKGDSVDSNNEKKVGNLNYKRVKIEDLLNKEELINKAKSSNDLNSRPGTADSISRPGSADSISRPGTADSTNSSGSAISHDSTISSAHVTIMEATRRLAKASELFTNQWNEGKILGENDKEKKEMMEKIIDFPDKKVFEALNWHLTWEANNALGAYGRKRNIPLVLPREKFVDMITSGYEETISDKDENRKYWTRLKAYIKEPIKDKNDLFEKLKKETLTQYVKGEEDSIKTGEKKNIPLELGGRKLKKGGLIAVYEEKKRTAEAAILQEEVRVKAKGREIKHIMPSFGRMSIFEMMNQSVGSVINDFKKLNIDSSTSDNIKDEIKTNSVKY